MRGHVWTLTSLAVALGVAAGLGGFAVAASGVIPIKASSGHWPITAWFLNFGKERSIATHTLGMALPDLADPTLVLRGAGHYETGCRPCHGSPEHTHPPIPAAMTPPPPDLPSIIAERTPEELFYVVRHGIKFTGMPGWPARGRDDEVRAVVAFLLALPALDAAGYRALVYGDVPGYGGAESVQELAASAPSPHAALLRCARCHGVDGNGRERAAYPKLAGQPRAYLEHALEAYARGDRPSGMMAPLAAGLEPRELRLLAEHYSRQPRRRSLAAHDPAAVERGRSIALHGDEARGVPSCADCHGPSAHARNPRYPELAGQLAEYLVDQLELFHEGRRGGSSYVHLMAHVAPRLSADQMRDVAAYYAALDPSEARATALAPAHAGP